MTAIRPETPVYRDGVRRVVTEAFGGHGPQVADLVDALAGHRVVSLVAEDRGEIVGHVQLSRSWVDARERLVDVLVLSPLAVRLDHRGVGLGAALVDAALESADSLGAPLVFLEGDPGFYGRLGFERGGARGFVRPSTRIPDAAFQVRVLAAYEPWMRGALVYGEPFWAHDCVGLRDPRLSEVERHLG